MTLRNAPLWDGTGRISELICLGWQAKVLKFRNKWGALDAASLRVEWADAQSGIALRVDRRGCWLTSPRLRGEVGLLRAMQSIVRSNPGEGDYPRVRLRRESPSPRPSKSELRSSRPRKSGAREKCSAASTSSSYGGQVAPPILRGGRDRRRRQRCCAFALWTRTFGNVQTRLTRRNCRDDHYRFPGPCL
jgi:hypothetical protein